MTDDEHRELEDRIMAAELPPARNRNGFLLPVAGQVFGRLTVIGEAERIKANRRRTACICACGKHVDVLEYSLRTGQTQSCGCTRGEAKVTHGSRRRPDGKWDLLYAAWMAMRERCRPHSIHAANYADRGISVCPQWDDFVKFRADVGPHPGAGYSLDRIDNDGNYEPGNVRWATPATQARNQRRVRLSPEIAARIRSLRLAGLTQQAIADVVGCDRSMVGYIARGVNWK